MKTKLTDKMRSGSTRNDKMRDSFTTDAQCPIAAYINTQFRHASQHRASHKAGAYTIEQRLWHAKWQEDAQFEPCDAELVEESGVDLYLPITATKASTVHAFMKDMIKTNPKLIRFAATPKPDLNAEEELELVAELRQALNQQPGLNGMAVTKLARLVKSQFEQLAEQRAAVAAKDNEQYMQDDLVEADFYTQLERFTKYLIMYPYAVMLYPVEKTILEPTWVGDTIVMKEVVKERADVVSPFDYYWSSDCTAAGTGAYEIVVGTMSRGELEDLQDADSDVWDVHAIAETLEHFTKRAHHQWLSPHRNTERPSQFWGDSDTIEVLHFYGKMPSDIAFPDGVPAGVGSSVEVHSTICGRYTLKHRVIEKNVRKPRPTLVTSWVKRSGTLCGKGLGYILRDLQRSGNMSLRHLVTNAGFASAPTGEVDIKRVSRYYENAEDAFSIQPGRFSPVDPDILANSARPAYHFQNIPDNTAQFSNLLTMFMNLSDYVSGIPALLSGAPVGSGAMRTFRGMMQYQANAMRVIQAAFDNIDVDVLEPIGDAFTLQGLLDGRFKGDSRAIAYGLGGLLRDELEAQKAAENLQLITQMAGALPEAVPQGVLQWVINELLGNTGVPRDMLNGGAMPAQGMQPQPPASAPQTAVAG